MSAPLIFLDTETTGLALNDHIWEFAAIRRAVDGTETELHLFIEHDQGKCLKLPEKFLQDHLKRWDHTQSVPPQIAAQRIWNFTTRLTEGDQRAHIVGAVPNFDTERLTILLDRFGFHPDWHHHLIDIENLAVGYLAAKGETFPLPWNSDDLSRAIGVEPPTDTRHTAMGDAMWARDVYDHITSGAVA